MDDENAAEAAHEGAPVVWGREDKAESPRVWGAEEEAACVALGGPSNAEVEAEANGPYEPLEPLTEQERLEGIDHGGLVARPDLVVAYTMPVDLPEGWEQSYAVRRPAIVTRHNPDGTANLTVVLDGTMDRKPEVLRQIQAAGAVVGPAGAFAFLARVPYGPDRRGHWSRW